MIHLLLFLFFFFFFFNDTATTEIYTLSLHDALPTFAPDDATLHLIGGEGDRGHRSLGGGLGREPLDREGEDLLCLFIRAATRLLLQVPGQGGGIIPGLVLEPAQQLLLGLLGRQAGDLLEPGPRLALLGGERLIPILQRPAALLETAGTLFQAAESLLDLAATARGLLLECLARIHQLFLRREHDTLSGFPEQPFGLHRGRARRRLRSSALHAAADQVEQHPCSDASAEEG